MQTTIKYIEHIEARATITWKSYKTDSFRAACVLFESPDRVSFSRSSPQSHSDSVEVSAGGVFVSLFRMRASWPWPTYFKKIKSE